MNIERGVGSRDIDSIKKINDECHLYNEENEDNIDAQPQHAFEMNDLGTVSMEIEENGITANEMPESNDTDTPLVAKQKAFKCCQCDYETEHKTSMIRHVMWKIGYKPYQCGLCSFTDVLYIGKLVN